VKTKHDERREKYYLIRYLLNKFITNRYLSILQIIKRVRNWNSEMFNLLGESKNKSKFFTELLLN